MCTDCFDDQVENLAFECDLTLPEARQVALLGLNATDPDVHADALASLADPTVAGAYFEAFFGVFADLAPTMIDLQVGRAVAAGHDSAGVRLAAAHVAEHRGDVAGWIEQLDAALSRDPSFGPARLDRGYAAWLRGDATDACRWLDGVDHPKATVMQVALELREPIRLRVPRNHRCPCGSGAKSKACCRGTFSRPGADGWFLWLKTQLWLQRFPQDEALLRVVVELIGDDAHDEELLMGVRSEGTTTAIALLEAGLIERFGSVLGGLLPPGERGLVEQWRGERHRVWEVVEVDPGRSSVLVDVVAGEARTIPDDGQSCCVARGRLLYGPVLSCGDGWFMPSHLPLCEAVADSIAARIGAGADPMSIAVEVYDELRDASV